MHRLLRLVAVVILGSMAVVAQQGPGQATPAACSPKGQQLPFCKAVRGNRAEGWLAQSRSEVMARNGMVSTSQPLAAEAGLRILRQGGNAIDAAVATAAALNVVEPMMIGMAGDLFAIVYSAKDHKLYTLNASGMAPSGATVEHYASLGYKYVPGVSVPGPGGGMPRGGILTVTVPGTVEGWDQLLKKFGTMKFKQVLEPAAEYAEKGYPVSERISHDWNIPNALPLSGCCTQKDPDTDRRLDDSGAKPQARPDIQESRPGAFLPTAATAGPRRVL